MQVSMFRRAGFAFLAAAVFFSALPRAHAGPGDAEIPGSAFRSYTYTYYGEPAESPLPYVAERLLTGADIGTVPFDNPQDVYAAGDGTLFVADTNNDRIVEIDGRFQFVREFAGAVREDGSLAAFNKPQGVFVHRDGTIYVADTENGRIVHMTRDGRLIRTVEKPESDILPPNFVFRPVKLAVDPLDRLHVLGLNVNQGIMEFDRSGRFEGFLAAGKVYAGPIELFWRRISTREQLNRMANFAPIDYSNIDVDGDGFLYATIASIDERIVRQELFTGGSEQGAIVRKLNILGQDILPRTGRFPQIGDVDFPPSDDVSKAYRGVAQLTDVASAEYGVYYVLDNNRKKIFAYDGDGNLLYAFGGAGGESGGFRTPASLAVSGERLYVADKIAGTVAVFRMTRYAKAIRDAIALYETGEYGRSAAKWREVLKMNANLDIAYLGIGKAEFSAGNYKEAMRLFQLAHHQAWYSMAYKEYRKTVVEAAFLPVFFSALGLIVLIRAFNFFRNRKRKIRGDGAWQA